MTYKLAALVLISTVVLFFRLGAHRLQSWDEAIYAECAKEMLATGDYLTPYWNQEEFLQKPPLTIWATALLFSIFGVNEVAARSISALSGVACIALIFLIGRMFLSEGLALIAGLILLVTPHFNFYARQGGMDVPLTFFILLALYAFIKAGKDPRWQMLVGAAAGFAVLTKGVAAGPLLVTIAITVAFRRERLTRHSLMGLVLFVVIAGAWHFAMLWVHGRLFIQEYFSEQILARSTSVIDAGPQSPFFFLVIALYGLLPFTILLPFAAYRVYVERRFPIVLLFFAASTLLLYSLVPTKHPWYIIPIYPVTALILASWNKSKWIAALAILAAVHCAILDQSKWKEWEKEQGAIMQAQMGQGPFVTDMSVAPAVRFYSDRKICALPNNHTMGHLAKCD